MSFHSSNINHELYIGCFEIAFCCYFFDGRSKAIGRITAWITLHKLAAFENSF
jgi:hypothetical protein